MNIPMWFPFRFLFHKKTQKQPPRQLTICGLQVFSETPLSSLELSEIDSCWVWARWHGLTHDAKNILIYVGDSGDGIVNYKPPTVKIKKSELRQLRHELTHLLLYEELGQQDEAHQNSIWGKWHLL